MHHQIWIPAFSDLYFYYVYRSVIKYFDLQRHLRVAKIKKVCSFLCIIRHQFLSIKKLSSPLHLRTLLQTSSQQHPKHLIKWQNSPLMKKIILTSNWQFSLFLIIFPITNPLQTSGSQENLYFLSSRGINRGLLLFKTAICF
jgi:hypothetical protein